MATIGTGKYGTITGVLTPAGLPTTVGYYVDADNYFTLEDVDSSPDYHAIGARFAGETYSVADLDSAFPGPAIKIEITRLGAWNEIVVYGGATAGTVVKLYRFLVFDLPDSCTWTNDGGSSWVWTPTATPAEIEPSPNDADWYEYQKMPVIPGAYRRVSLLDASGDPTLVFSNGEDADHDLISVDIQEYHDPTTTKLQIDSCRFKIHTPFDKSTSEATITAFLENFAPTTAFNVDGGWTSLTSMGYEAYDVTGMGRFYITEARLDKQSWILEVEAEDEFGFFANVRYPYQLAITPDSLTRERHPLFYEWASFLTASACPTDSTLSLDPQILGTLVPTSGYFGVLHADVSILDLIRQQTNFSGGRWYLKHDNTRALICDTNIAPLDYKITPLMLYGVPLAEKIDTSPTPHTVAAYGYTTGATTETILEIPRAAGLASDGTEIDIVVPLPGVTEGEVYGVVGGVETRLYRRVSVYMYAAVVPSKTWTIGETSNEYERVIIKAKRITETTATEGNSDGAVLKNPLVTKKQEQNALASWSFPDYDGRAYRFTMRDDPSLKCGNVVQLAVDNAYLNVILVEAKRSFNGAGRTEYLAYYLSDTGEDVYTTAVTNAVATWKDVDDETSGAVLAWDAVTGYDDWPNADLRYRVYGPDGTLITTLDGTIVTFDDDTILAPGDEYGVALIANSFEYLPVTAATTPFAQSAHTDRFAGETLFYAGQDRLLYDS